MQTKCDSDFSMTDEARLVINLELTAMPNCGECCVSKRSHLLLLLEKLGIQQTFMFIKPVVSVVHIYTSKMLPSDETKNKNG